MKWFAILYIVCWNSISHAQSVSTLMGARSAGMGYVSANLNDEYAMLNNVGALAEVSSLSTAFAYEARQSLPGANRMAAAISIPTSVGTAGISLFRFGDDVYSEQMASVGYSNKFGIASLGVKANYIQYRAVGFGSKNAISLTFGGLATITPQISIGAYIVNINQARISESEQLPTRLTAGIAFKPDEHFFVTTEIEKDLEYNATWKIGGEYPIQKKIFARTGFNLNPSTLYFGLGARTAKLSIDYALSYSRVLGGTHQVSAIYRISRVKKKG